MGEVIFHDSELRLDLLSYLVWPKEEQKREAFCMFSADVYQDMLSETWDSRSSQSILKLANLNDAAMYGEIAKNPSQFDAQIAIQHEEFIEGFQATFINKDNRGKLTEQFGFPNLMDEIFKNIKEMYQAACVVHVLTSMIQNHENDCRLIGGPSLNKAKKVAAAWFAVSEKTIERSWSKYKSVSHFLSGLAAIKSTTGHYDFHENLLAIPVLMVDAKKGGRRKFYEFIYNSRFFHMVLNDYTPSNSQSEIKELNLWMESDPSSDEFLFRPLALEPLRNRDFECLTVLE